MGDDKGKIKKLVGLVKMGDCIIGNLIGILWMDKILWIGH